jgi:wyosine [tRNA(Phe)-imidazoG37] synthetase (radical SAM superfamily)
MSGLPLVFADHRRSFEDNRYVYAVVSRRSRGVSIGINLNPDKVCNFDCVYCQVDRTTPGAGPVVRAEPSDKVKLRQVTRIDKDVDLALLERELAEVLAICASGAIFTLERFRQTPDYLRRLNDIAFSGDGEPTSCLVFLEAVRLAERLRELTGLTEGVKLVLITNSTLLHRPRVREALEIFKNHNGEVWAKLDAGTEAYYHQVERTVIPLDRVLTNLGELARRQPIVIQSLFLKMDGIGPDAAEIESYCDRLVEIVRAGGTLDRVQVHTVARRPAESNVTALTNNEVDTIALRIRERVGIPVEVFYGG